MDEKFVFALSNQSLSTLTRFAISQRGSTSAVLLLERVDAAARQPAAAVWPSAAFCCPFDDGSASPSPSSRTSQAQRR
jgi:hypothetical protein